MTDAKPTVARGIRGAITLEENTRDAIMDATEELLQAMTAANDIDSADLAGVYFTVTADIDAEFPAAAARERLDWRFVPLINSVEIPVTGSMPMCIRVMMFWNTVKSQQEVRHVYLKGAVKLRADITDAQ